jgi:hypothetical protein
MTPENAGENSKISVSAAFLGGSSAFPAFLS